MSTDALTALGRARAGGAPRGITSVCSAHELVIEAALLQAAEDGTEALLLRTDFVDVLAAALHGGVVDQDVQPAELGGGLLDDHLAMALLGHVTGHQHRAASGLADPLGGVLGVVQRGDQRVRALPDVRLALGPSEISPPAQPAVKA